MQMDKCDEKNINKSLKMHRYLCFAQDTAEFALKFQMESPIKKGQYSTHDRFIHERVLAQVLTILCSISINI